MPKIFISYRRSDSEERTHAIANWLVSKYGKDNVFIDVDTIRGGADFADIIESSLKYSNVLLVIIGHQWVDELERRTKIGEIDFVRSEVVYGLKNIPFIIPVLLERAIPIEKNRLPEDVQPLLRRNFMVARKLPDFHRDMQDIKEVIDKETAKPITWQIFGGITVILALITIVYLGSSAQNNNEIGNSSQLAQATEEQTPEITELPSDTATLTNVPSITPTQTETPRSMTTVDISVTLTLQPPSNTAQPLPELTPDFGFENVEDNSVFYESLGVAHYDSDTPRTYNSNPPTSGPHNSNWVSPLGIYTTSFSDDWLIHNLEHGHVWLSYRDTGDTDALALLSAIQQKYPDRIVVTLRPENNIRIAVAAWTRLLVLDELDQEQIEAFIIRYSDQAPESIME